MASGNTFFWPQSAKNSNKIRVFTGKMSFMIKGDKNPPPPDDIGMFDEKKKSMESKLR